MSKRPVASWLKSRRVAVLKGGWSRERSISLKTGEAVEASFKRMGIKCLGLDVTPALLDQLVRQKIQFCFNALHGPFGEDGQIQTYLDYMNIPYTGSGASASAIAMDKDLAKKIFVEKNIPTPDWILLHTLNDVPVKKFLKKGPLFVKPFDQGSAIGAQKVSKTSEINKALSACFKVSSAALVEKFVKGRELTVGILGNRVLPVIEIVPEHAFYDFHSKYSKGGSRHITPAPISRSSTLTAQGMALRAFRALGCSVYGRVDILLDHKGRMSVLEVNTIPGMTATSLLPEAAQAVGINFDQLVLKIVELSLQERTPSPT